MEFLQRIVDGCLKVSGLLSANVSRDIGYQFLRLGTALEQAAADLYANEWQTFWRVTFPLVLPGIVSAALLSFSLSFDDFIISYFNAGTLVTFPIFIWGAAQRGIPVQVNALATLGVLRHLPSAPAPIERIHISSRGDFGAVRLDARERGFAAFAKAPNSGTSGNVRHRIGAGEPNTG